MLAGIYVVHNKNKFKYILMCDGKNIKISTISKGVEFKLKNMPFVVGNEKTNYKNSHKIIFLNNQIKPNVLACSKRKIYLFCDNYGISFVKNKKLKRKFNKYSKIILK